jgi:hypothetical protein
LLINHFVNSFLFLHDFGLIDKIQATIDINPYKDIALVNLKAMNKKNAFTVVVQEPRKMVIKAGFKSLNVLIVTVNSLVEHG